MIEECRRPASAPTCGWAFRHVVRNADRLAVSCLGLLLLVRRWRDLGYLVLALAGGYLLALLLAMAGWVLPRLVPLEAFMGFLVALLGAVITRRELQSARTAALGLPTMMLLLVLAVALLRSPSALFMLLGGAAIAMGFLGLSRDFANPLQVWPGLAVLFGFVDGCVLPAVLPAAQLPQWLQLLDADRLLIWGRCCSMRCCWDWPSPRGCCCAHPTHQPAADEVP